MDVSDELLDAVATEICGRIRRMSPLSRGRGAATTMIAAVGIANRRPSFVRRKRIVTLMRLADAAGMRGRSYGRHRQRKKISREREEQQQSGSQTMHVSCESYN